MRNILLSVLHHFTDYFTTAISVDRAGLLFPILHSFISVLTAAVFHAIASIIAKAGEEMTVVKISSALE